MEMRGNDLLLKKAWQEQRCPHCNRLLFKGRYELLEIKCPKCGTVQIFSAERLPQRPTRVVALNASNVDLYYAAGGCLVGRPNTSALAPEILQKIKDIPVVGNTANPDIKQIIALRPDLVLAPSLPFHQSIIPALEHAGIPVYVQSLNSYPQIIDVLHFYGYLTGQEHQAHTVVKNLERRVRVLEGKTGGRSTPRVLIIWGSSDNFTMALSNSFAGQLACRLRAVNVADELTARAKTEMPFVRLQLEAVANANPDIILVITHNVEAEVLARFNQELVRNPVWKRIKAVRDNRVYKLPYSLFAVNPGTRIVEALEYLSGLLYPEIGRSS